MQCPACLERQKERSLKHISCRRVRLFKVYLRLIGRRWRHGPGKCLSNDDKIAWYENTDGKGTLKSMIVSTSANGAQSVFAADLDGDGDMDLASASENDDKIAWYENTDGKGTLEVNRSCR